MRKLPFVLALFAALQILGMPQSKHAKSPIPPEIFLVDHSKPYVYLEVVRVGPRIPRSDDEPKMGIWLRLHNNCIVPIMVRTFGVPQGSRDNEVGVLDNVVPNPVEGISEGTSWADNWPPTSSPFDSGASAKESLQTASAKITPASMPHGYGGDVSSFQTLAPGQSIYFSLPRNQVSPKWHVEIPFRFDLKVHSTLTSAYSFVALYEGDITSQLQTSKP